MYFRVSLPSSAPDQATHSNHSNTSVRQLSHKKVEIEDDLSSTASDLDNYNQDAFSKREKKELVDYMIKMRRKQLKVVKRLDAIEKVFLDSSSTQKIKKLYRNDSKLCTRASRENTKSIF